MRNGRNALIWAVAATWGSDCKPTASSGHIHLSAVTQTALRRRPIANHTHSLLILDTRAIMSNLIDAEAGTERFGGYEAELKLVQADLSQQIEQIKETTGEPRKAAISRAERALEEADELVRGSLEAQTPDYTAQ